MWKQGLLTKLAELAVGDEQRAQGAETLEGLVAVLLGSVLSNGSIGSADSLGVELHALPDKVLDQIALVLGEQELLGLSDDSPYIVDELAALGGQAV